MTDPEFADCDLRRADHAEFVEQIIASRSGPDARCWPTLGGQTALNRADGAARRAACSTATASS
jgi:carbamoylphosphate synthase large subunit